MKPSQNHTLEILRKHSHSKSRLSCADVVRIMQREHGLKCDRRMISRHLDALISSGAPILIESRRFYLMRSKFSDAELMALIDGVLASRYITADHADDLIGRLAALGSARLESRIKGVQKIDGKSRAGFSDIFSNVEKISEAIAKGVKIDFSYNKVNRFKKLAPTGRMKRNVSPYKLTIHNQRYYLICNFDGREGYACCRVDKMKNIKILKTAAAEKPLQSGLDIDDVHTFPYLFMEPPEQALLVMKERFIDDVMDWFGNGFEVEKIPDSQKVQVRLKAPPTALLYWLLQYGGNVELIEPQHMRVRIQQAVLEMASVYMSPSPA